MQFLTRKKKSPPGIIIVSLIDVLIVLLIFMMVTTTFKQQPAVRLALPESKQPKQGSSENSLVVTITKQEPRLYLEKLPITFAQLQQELIKRANENPKIILSIRADTDAPFGEIIKVMDAAKGAHIEKVNAFTKNAVTP